MKISVIIPTYNGAHKLPVLLNAVLQQTKLPDEIIIVIDGSNDNTLQVLEPYQKKTSLFKIIIQENRGRSAVRNRGVKEASGDLLVFYDDDMQPLSTSIEKHYNFHFQYSGILGGNQIEFVSKTKTDIQNYKAHLTQKWTSKYANGLNKLDKANLFFTAANCSIKQKDFLQLQGFDEQLTDSEDHDFAIRGLAKGIDVYFDKSNEAIHHDAITCSTYIMRLRDYRKARIKLAALRPSHYQSINQTSLINKVYWFFSFAVLVKWIDKNYFIIIPKPIRYKFFDVVIHSLGVVYPEVILR